jgi:hypothetical protein
MKPTDQIRIGIEWLFFAHIHPVKISNFSSVERQPSYLKRLYQVLREVFLLSNVIDPLSSVPTVEFMDKSGPGLKNCLKKLIKG